MESLKVNDVNMMFDVERCEGCKNTTRQKIFSKATTVAERTQNDVLRLLLALVCVL